MLYAVIGWVGIDFFLIREYIKKVRTLWDRQDYSNALVILKEITQSLNDEVRV